MKSISESPLNKITLALILSLLLAASLWVWLTLPPVQAQGGDEELWRTLDTPFENVGRVLEDKGGNIWAVSSMGITSSSTATDTQILEEGRSIPGQELENRCYRATKNVARLVEAYSCLRESRPQIGHWRSKAWLRS